ncbi:class I SAM-dependent methyltransferase [Niallia circulans]|uniref:Class I SAM-dependent methyltransferase n=1 Tax=Niallia circulans TaxID=1397 RepID=A0A553SNR0_NIACI|nr:class I SAM-dependent methyltransferase [Niallia circulans]TRZ38640.1 class I SAM-dependent methyltransferase [Niallia circulans]
METVKQDTWNASLYDGKHSFVSNYGGDLISLLSPRPEEKILDLGCGTGDLASRLAGYDCEVIGIDNSPNMIAQAQKKYPHIPFFVEDATSLPFDSRFTAVFSNAALHWIKSPKQALTSIYNSLQQGGRFVAEFGGKGNVQIITDTIIEEYATQGISFNWENFPWYFPSIAEYTQLMEEAGFRVVFAQHFDRPTPLDGENGLSNWIEMFGDSFFKGLSENKKAMITQKVSKKLHPQVYKDGAWQIDYKRIRVIGIKE